ncbi:MAG TPA: M56 family metallopeptidase [Bryobacteraceae bacterium]|jgi:Zn-dependent protease with chaperone function|nr:M56 family metallopeptidase [Bryobacteraceae bacterium]
MSYGFKLACVSLAAFLIVNWTAAMMVSGIAPAAIRAAAGMRARSAARLLWTLRMAPSAAALLAVMALGVPSYLRFEPEGDGEAVGAACLVTALLAIAAPLNSMMRSARAVWRSRRAAGLPIAMAGVIQPRLVLSGEIPRLLSSEELDAALRHEYAHAASRDNLKRLLMLLAPDSFAFFRPLASVERAWKKFAEWAADDEAVSGDRRRAVALASALVRVARLGAAAKYELVTPLIEEDLALRVERLLDDSHPPARPAIRGPWTLAACIAGLAVIFAIILQPGAQSGAYALLEALIR